MLTVVLTILRAPSLLTPGETKTRSIAFFTLTALQLPATVITPTADALLDVLNTVFTAYTTSGTKTGCFEDALKVCISHNGRTISMY